jgi:CheY-like chemotaxis protein
MAGTSGYSFFGPSRLGYEVPAFTDSPAALAAFEAAPERFDFVVTDEVMPGLTGTGRARVLRHHP